MSYHEARKGHLQLINNQDPFRVEEALMEFGQTGFTLMTCNLVILKRARSLYGMNGLYIDIYEPQFEYVTASP